MELHLEQDWWPVRPPVLGRHTAPREYSVEVMGTVRNGSGTELLGPDTMQPVREPRWVSVRSRDPMTTVFYEGCGFQPMAESFEWMSLDPNEEVVWTGRPRLHVVLWVAVPALAVPGVLVVVWQTLLAAFVGMLAWVTITALAYVFVTNIDYVVSTKYVYAKRGVLGRSVTQLGLHNIQDTTLSQGIFGTYSGYGTVSFSTAGGEGTTLSFHVVDDPSSVQSAIDRQVREARTVANAVESHHARGGVDDLLSELRATREAAHRIDQALAQGGDRS